MENLDQNRFALASGLTSVAIYLGCFLIMLILGKESLVKLSNLIFHGMDFANIIRTEIPIVETLIGAVASFMFWGLIGYLLALIYNKMK
jgi:hypothetical protein